MVASNASVESDEANGELTEELHNLQSDLVVLLECVEDVKRRLDSVIERRRSDRGTSGAG